MLIILLELHLDSNKQSKHKGEKMLKEIKLSDEFDSDMEDWEEELEDDGYTQNSQYDDDDYYDPNSEYEE